MSNNMYCVPDENDSRKKVYIGVFLIYVSFGEENIKDKITANAALR